MRLSAADLRPGDAGAGFRKCGWVYICGFMRWAGDGSVRPNSRAVLLSNHQSPITNHQQIAPPRSKASEHCLFCSIFATAQLLSQYYLIPRNDAHGPGIISCERPSTGYPVVYIIIRYNELFSRCGVSSFAP